MSDYETLSIVILIIGLVISAITLGFAIGNKEKIIATSSCKF